MHLGFSRLWASVVVLGGLTVGGTSPAFAAGMGITPNFPPNQAPQDVIGFRYRTRVHVNNSPTIKIVFGWKRFYNPTGDTDTYLLETNLYSNWLKYPDSACLGWPPNSPTNQYFSGESGLWVSVSDYPKKSFVGVRQSDAQTLAMFPRQNSGIDAIGGLTKIETIAQQNMTGKDIDVEYTRGGTFTQPLAGWGHRFSPDPSNPGSYICDPNLPAATYQIWNAKVTFDNQTYNWEFALPASSAKYFAPWDIVTFAVEFFDQPNFFQTYIWDLEIERESSPKTWKPVLSWRVNYLTEPSNNGWGPKLGSYNGQTVIELSNDGTNTYYPLDAVFELPEPPPKPDAGAAGAAGSGGSAGESTDGGPSAGGTSSGGTSTGGTSSGGAPSGGSAGSSAKGSGDSDDSGCGCRTPTQSENHGSAWFIGLSLACLARRRAKRHY